MHVRTAIAGLIVLSSAVATSALAQNPYIYPQKGQSAAQIERDQSECYSWARNQTGFDPSARQMATRPPPRQSEEEGQIVRGGVRGALLGGIIDGSDGAKKGAAAGALFGGMRKSDRRRRQEEEQRRWEQEQADNYNYNRNQFDRAFSACIEARGYTVR